MNKYQRRQLVKALDILSTVYEEEEEKISNMEENFSETEQFQNMTEKADELCEIKETLESFLE